MCKFAGCSYPSNSQKLLEIHEEMKEPFRISSLERHYTIRLHKIWHAPFDLDQFLEFRLEMDQYMNGSMYLRALCISDAGTKPFSIS